MIINELQVRAEYSFNLGKYQVYLFQENQNGKRFFATDIVFKPVEENYDRNVPLQLDKESAQQLMDDLWRAGLRPAELKNTPDTSTALKATQYHLEDMRKIAFERLMPPRPDSWGEKLNPI